MYQCILFITFFLNKPFQYKCEIKDTKTKLQAIIMPFNNTECTQCNFTNITIHTNNTQNHSNIEAKKINISIWLKKNSQKYFKNDEVVIIDQVYDIITNKVSKLINPYIVIIRQDEVLESYKLQHLKMVNAEVKEKVINKETNPHYLGCYTDLKRSSCKTMMANNIPIKYSEGFCCSCEMAINIKRQLSDCQGRSRFKHVIHTTKNYNEEFEMVIDQIVDNITLNNEIIKMHDEKSNITKQIRGGQNCDNTITPAYIKEPYRYHESSHCLQFSDLWYNINKLQSASYYHSLTLSIYEKFIKDNKPGYKKIFSKAKLSSTNENYENDESTVKANYMSLTFEDNQYYSLDIDCDRLLIPEKVPSVVQHLYPQATDDPNKYLIVHVNNISIKGDECNKVGVSYEAFYKQQNRCGEPKFSCLNNQPSHLWKHDMDEISLGNPGNYFLENFVKFPQNTDIIQEINRTKILNVLYEMDYTCELLIQTTTNYNSELSTRSLLEIVEIYSDATKRDQTTIVVAVYNIGMKSDLFRIQLIQLFSNTKKNCTKVEGLEKQIFPFHRYNYVLNFNESFIKFNMNFTIQVIDKWNKIIAWRQIVISEANRCFCVWKCKCSCTSIENQSFTSKCKSMSKKNYNDAGFRGLPSPNLNLKSPILSYNTILIITHLTLLITTTQWIIIILIGLVKAMTGLFYKPISLLGLNLIFHEKSKNLKYYLEPEICSVYVVYDDNGYVVHPHTKTRTIQLVSKKTEIKTNIFYIFLFLIYFLKKWCFTRICKTNN